MRERLRELPDASLDSCVTDPPYHLTSIVKRFGSPNAAPIKIKKHDGQGGSPFARSAKGFMGQTWDGGDVAFDPATWAEIARVLKPGAHLVAFSGTRTYHRMACAIEDAGFEIRDQLAWVYGSGFPKSHDVVKGIDKAAGAERERVPARGGLHNNRLLNDDGWQNIGAADATMSSDESVTAAAAAWEGWGTALKPAWEPICLARKPLVGTVAGNVLQHGTGALNIDGCRIEGAKPNTTRGAGGQHGRFSELGAQGRILDDGKGRWPANIIHDGSDEVLAHFPNVASGAPAGIKAGGSKHVYGEFAGGIPVTGYGDEGSAARFFYSAKVTSAERGEGNNHPTVKPVDLMRWLCRLVTPKGGTVLDPFCGSGSTLIAADAEQFHAIGCELSPDYAAIAERRIRQSAGMFAEVRAE